PPAPNVDLYKPRKRKRNVKTFEEEDQKEEKVVKEVGKKKGEKKRKAGGVKIDESRSKKKHVKIAGKNDSGTKSDERTLAQRLKQTSKETFKKHLKNF
ncbi:hypothetical protein A2U01_0073715, partial [Trifolium medium]|nr:hypothetical protein [Trifolium medium]